MSSQKTGRDKEKLKRFARIERFHPYKTFLFFGLLGSAVLFLALTLFYVIKISSMETLSGFRLPKVFFVSTVVMLFSSYFLTMTVQAFKQDKINELALLFSATLILSLLFSALQFAGWKQLYHAGFFVSSQPGVSFLFIISGLHLLHVIIGIFYMLSCVLPVYAASRDMVKSLVYFSDKYQQTRIELLNIYWHYVDLLWLSLFFMFLFTL